MQVVLIVIIINWIKVWYQAFMSSSVSRKEEKNLYTLKTAISTFLASGTGSWKTVFPQTGAGSGNGFRDDSHKECTT